MDVDRRMVQQIVAKFDDDVLAQIDVEAWLNEKLEGQHGCECDELIEDAVESALGGIVYDVMSNMRSARKREKGKV